MAQPAIRQYTEGEGREPEHSHPPVVHTHDHYHVVHYHREDGGFDHREYWHTHEHNHSQLVHSHDFEQGDENDRHGKEAHIHDHAAPAQSPA